MAAAAPFALKALPYVGSAVAGLFGKKASGPSKEQAAAMQGTQAGAQAGGELLSRGAGYMGEAARSLQPAAQYYRNILGSRSQAMNAMAPETTTALEYYRGAENKTRRTMQGGARDQALAELDRQKVGQIAGFLPAARRTAAEGMTDVGQVYGGLGSSAAQIGTTGMYANNALYNQASDLEKQKQEGGKTWGSFIFDILKNVKLGGGGGVTGITNTIPNIGGMLPSPPPGMR